MMGLVFVCAVGFAALMHPRSVVASATYTGALTVLLFATLAALRGRYRTFWTGFAVAGWTYFYVAFLSFSSQTHNPYIFTNKILIYVFPKLEIPWDSPMAVPTGTPVPMALPASAIPGVMSSDETIAPVPFEFSPQWIAFARIGHSLAAIVHGFAGGAVIVLLERRARRSGMKKEGPQPGPLPDGVD
ncbi:MAG TPA: hypothetical protein VG406_22450 [Isosphaeraceae bacterium]|jgi:hypothetical protein|nr:hypothetical protein [Isosphaeraceae bacterium]